MNFERVNHCQKANRYLRYLNAIIPPRDLLALFAQGGRGVSTMERSKLRKGKSIHGKKALNQHEDAAKSGRLSVRIHKPSLGNSSPFHSPR